MYSVILSKKLNNTELGLTGIHETYIYIPQDLDVSDLFEEREVTKRFFSVQKNRHYDLRFTSGREKRIVGLGKFYRDFNASAGDEITLERRVGKKEDYFISLRQNPNSVAIQKLKHGFEVLTPDRLGLISEHGTIEVEGASNTFALPFMEKIKKRADSPNATSIYDLLVNGVSWASRYAAGTLIELCVCENKVMIKEFYGWKKMTIGEIPDE